MAKEKKLIGRIEYIDMLEIGLEGLKAKIDTGAYTSSIHCDKVKEITDEAGVKHLQVVIKLSGTKKTRAFDTYQLVKVRSSNGTLQRRYKIKTRIKLGAKIYKAEFTLTDRSSMRYPILLGRKLLKGRFLVDVSKSFMLAPQ